MGQRSGSMMGLGLRIHIGAWIVDPYWGRIKCTHHKARIVDSYRSWDCGTMLGSGFWIYHRAKIRDPYWGWDCRTILGPESWTHVEARIVDLYWDQDCGSTLD